MIKGAVFDMDGLMFDSEKLVYENWKTMLNELGFEYDIEIFKNTIGLRTDETKRYYNSLYKENFNYDELKIRSRKMFFDRVEREGVPIKKGLFELLDFLKENNIKMAVATSTSRQSCERMLKKSGAYPYFDEIICGDDVTKGKPHPEVFLKASERLGIAPQYCIALEDSINGIKSAHSAGMITIMVPDFLQPTDEINPVINCLCNDLTEVIEYVKTSNFSFNITNI